MDVDRILDRRHLRALFSDRAVVATGLAQGMRRDLAAGVSEPAGRGEAMPSLREPTRGQAPDER